VQELRLLRSCPSPPAPSKPGVLVDMRAFVVQITDMAHRGANLRGLASRGVGAVDHFATTLWQQFLSAGLMYRRVLRWPHEQARTGWLHELFHRQVCIGVFFGGLMNISVLRASCIHCARPSRKLIGDGEMTNSTDMAHIVLYFVDLTGLFADLSVFA
jgi:hypothetical protein